jgi:hypothetical protein
MVGFSFVRNQFSSYLNENNVCTGFGQSESHGRHHGRLVGERKHLDKSLHVARFVDDRTDTVPVWRLRIAGLKKAPPSRKKDCGCNLLL